MTHNEYLKLQDYVGAEALNNLMNMAQTMNIFEFMKQIQLIIVLNKELKFVIKTLKRLAIRFYNDMND